MKTNEDIADKPASDEPMLDLAVDIEVAYGISNCLWRILADRDEKELQIIGYALYGVVRALDAAWNDFERVDALRA